MKVKKERVPGKRDNMCQGQEMRDSMVHSENMKRFSMVKAVKKEE